MKRKKLDINVETPKRGAQKGDAPRNPTGKGGFKPGQSGNPAGRPTGSTNKVQLANIWDSWKSSNALGLLHCFLNFRPPLSMAPHGRAQLTDKEDRELRALLFKGFFLSLDFVRKSCGSKFQEDMGGIPMTIKEMLAESKAKENPKVIDFGDKLREKGK